MPKWYKAHFGDPYAVEAFWGPLFVASRNSRLHLGFYNDIRFQALNWYSEFALPPRIL